MITVPALWPGSTIVCLGGGPSLTLADVEACRGRARVIAVNDAYLLAPWADVLYACDEKWWRMQHRYQREAIDAFAGLRYAMQPTPHHRMTATWPRLQVLRNTGEQGLELDPTGLRTGRNSGYQAINLAVHLGATRVVLLGYDMQARGTQTHWVGHHPTGTRSPYGLFKKQSASLVQPLRAAGVEVRNCSRETALTYFQRADLDASLPQRSEAAA